MHFSCKQQTRLKSSIAKIRRRNIRIRNIMFRWPCMVTIDYIVLVKAHFFSKATVLPQKTMLFFVEIQYTYVEYEGWHGGVVVSAPHSKNVWGSNLGFGFSVRSLRVLLVHVWVFSGLSGFLPQSKNMVVR